MDHPQTRLDALEQRTHIVARPLRWWHGPAGGLLMLAVLTWAPPAVQAASLPVSWDAGNFRALEAMSGDLVTFVQGLEHPNSGGYGRVSPTRQANFTRFLDALFAAVEASLADGATGDWCGVQTAARAAGYAVARFYDTASGRWFVYAYDTTPFGQAYVFINPFAKRNLVIEVPHEDFEPGTKSQGARLFTALAARALLINREHRCSDRNVSPCTGRTTVCNASPCSEPTGCDGRFRESDVAHHPANTFIWCTSATRTWTR
jgi:hypothetical protein